MLCWWGWMPGQMWVTRGHHHPFFRDPPLSQDIHLCRVLTLVGLNEIVAICGWDRDAGTPADVPRSPGSMIGLLNVVLCQPALVMHCVGPTVG